MPQRLAFTLMELLIAMAIIGILASFFFLVLNPARQVQKANTAQYSVKRNEVQKALTQFVIDEQGTISVKPDNVLGDEMKPICRYGTTELSAAFDGTDGPCIILDKLIDEDFIVDLPVLPSSIPPYSGFYAKIDCKNRIGVTYDGDPNPPPLSCDCGVKPKLELVIISDSSGSFRGELSQLNQKMSLFERVLQDKGFQLINWNISHGNSSLYVLQPIYASDRTFIDSLSPGTIDGEINVNPCPLCGGGNAPSADEAWGLGALWALDGGRIWHPSSDQKVLIFFADALPAGSNGFLQPYQTTIANAARAAIERENVAAIMLHGDTEVISGNPTITEELYESTFGISNVFDYSGTTDDELLDVFTEAVNQVIEGCA